MSDERSVPRVVVAGVICLDLLPELPFAGGDAFQSAFTPGRIVEAGNLAFALGGAVPNTGLALHRLGVPVDLVGKIGDDIVGDLICRRLEEESPGLSREIRRAAGVQSSYSVVLNPPGMDRIILHARGANDALHAVDVEPALQENVRLLHFGYPPTIRTMFEHDGEELFRLFSVARRQGILTSLDMSLPDRGGAAARVDWRAWLQRVLPCVDFFLPSLEELQFMLDPEERLEPSQLAAQCLEAGARVVGIKLGEEGFYLRCGPEAPGWPEGEWRDGCYEVEVVGTVGAGDTTIAGFLAGYLRGLAPRDCVNAALAVGACSVEASDALGGIRSWEETMARVTAGWSRRAKC